MAFSILQEPRYEKPFTQKKVHPLPNKVNLHINASIVSSKTILKLPLINKKWFYQSS